MRGEMRVNGFVLHGGRWVQHGVVVFGSLLPVGDAGGRIAFN